MYWTDYPKGAKKAKIHLGFDLNRKISGKIYFKNGKWAERVFVDPITAIDQTVVDDRGYQEHALFDYLQSQNKHFVDRIKASTTITVIMANDIDSGSIVFHNAEVLLGTMENKNQSQKPVRLDRYHSVKVRPGLKDSKPRILGGAMARKQDGEALRYIAS